MLAARYVHGTFEFSTKGDWLFNGDLSLYTVFYFKVTGVIFACNVSDKEVIIVFIL